MLFVASLSSLNSTQRTGELSFREPKEVSRENMDGFYLPSISPAVNHGAALLSSPAEDRKRAGSCLVDVGSNEGFPSVNNDIRRTDCVPVLRYSLRVFISTKGEIRVLPSAYKVCLHYTSEYLFLQTPPWLGNSRTVLFINDLWWKVKPVFSLTQRQSCTVKTKNLVHFIRISRN